jgi:hypothetical protein
VTHEDAKLPPDEVDALRFAGPPASTVTTSFDAAIRVVGELTMALTSAIGDLAFTDALRLRNELSRAFSRAQNLIERTNPAKSEAAVRQLGAMRGVADRLFQNAPAPSAAAIAAASTGDLTGLNRAEDAWLADRLASGATLRLQQHGRSRRDTRPDSPRAWRAPRSSDRDPVAVSAPEQSVEAMWDGDTQEMATDD